MRDMQILDNQYRRDETPLQDILAVAAAYYERSYPDLRIEGPIDPAATSESEIAGQARAFAKWYISTTAPYLDNPFHQGINRTLGGVAPAMWFIAACGGEVLGTVRLRMGAHEFPHMANELRSAAMLVEGFAEYSRLMVRPAERSLGIGRLLVTQATRWLMAETAAQGIVALCQRETATVFRQYGLKPLLRGVTLGDRADGTYDLVAGSWATIHERLSAQLPREILSLRMSGDRVNFSNNGGRAWKPPTPT
jgi:GNAT superfamily N-acetyltransferase